MTSLPFASRCSQILDRFVATSKSDVDQRATDHRLPRRELSDLVLINENLVASIVGTIVQPQRSSSKYQAPKTYRPLIRPVDPVNQYGKFDKYA